LNDKLTGKEITLDVDKKLREKIKVAGFDEKYGARPMKNAFNRLVIRPFSKILLADPHMKGSYQLTVDEHNQLRMNPAK